MAKRSRVPETKPKGGDARAAATPYELFMRSLSRNLYGDEAGMIASAKNTYSELETKGLH